MTLRIETLTVGMLSANCFYLSHRDHPGTVIVDPGGDAETILEHWERNGKPPAQIWLTHAHIDHIGALAQVARETGAPVYAHPEEREWLRSEVLCGASWLHMKFDPYLGEPTPLVDNGTLDALGRQWRTLHTPGHSPGSVTFHSPQDDAAIVGDTIFRGSVGRVDLPGGNGRTFRLTIQRMYRDLPPETRLYCGHGPDTTMELERERNDYVRLMLFGTVHP